MSLVRQSRFLAQGSSVTKNGLWPGNRRFDQAVGSLDEVTLWLFRDGNLVSRRCRGDLDWSCRGDWKRSCRRRHFRRCVCFVDSGSDDAPCPLVFADECWRYERSATCWERIPRFKSKGFEESAWINFVILPFSMTEKDPSSPISGFCIFFSLFVIGCRLPTQVRENWGGVQSRSERETLTLSSYSIIGTRIHI